MEPVGPTAGDLPDSAHQALRLAETYVFGTEPGRIPVVLHEAFEASSDDRVRARLGATLARCWVYAGAHTRAVPFADAALAHATATGDAALLADALDAALATHWGPDELSVRTGLARQLDDVTAHLTDVDARTQAHLWMLTVALELLDLPAMNRQMRALELLGEDRREHCSSRPQGGSPSTWFGEDGHCGGTRRGSRPGVGDGRAGRRLAGRVQHARVRRSPQRRPGHGR